MENSKFLKKLEMGEIHDQALSFLKHTHKGLYSIHYIYVISSLFEIIQKWKQPRCPSADKWIKNYAIFTHWKFLAVKKMKL